MSDDEEKLWTDDDAAKFLKLKVEDLGTPLGMGARDAVVAIVEGERRWSPTRLRKWLAIFGHLVGISTAKKSPGSGGPRP